MAINPRTTTPGVGIGSARADVICLALGERTTELDIVHTLLSTAGTKVQLLNPGSLVEARALLRQHPVALVFVDAPSGQHPLHPLGRSVGVRCLGFPPAVALGAGPISSGQRERLRNAGVSALIDAAAVDPPALRLLLGLAASQSWFRATIGHVSVADALQTLERKPGPLLLTVSCPHWAALSANTWSQLSPHYCRGDGSDTACEGWYGRVYVAEGLVLHAETPTASGIDALASLLELQEGEVRIQEVQLIPSGRAPLGAITNCILSAAVAADEWSYRDTQVASDAVPSALPGRARATGPAAAPATRPPPSLPGDELSSDGDFKLSFEPLHPVPAEARRATPTNATRPSEAPATSDPSLTRVAAAHPGLHTLAICDERGWVTEGSGTADTDTLCAAAAMGRAQLQEAGSMLEMGSVEGWALLGDNVAIYVVDTGDGLLTASGEPTGSAEAGLQRVINALKR